MYELLDDMNYRFFVAGWSGIDRNIIHVIVGSFHKKYWFMHFNWLMKNINSKNIFLPITVPNSLYRYELVHESDDEIVDALSEVCVRNGMNGGMKEVLWANEGENNGVIKRYHVKVGNISSALSTVHELWNMFGLNADEEEPALETLVMR